jgi:nicotinamide mononucleotide transporter
MYIYKDLYVTSLLYAVFLGLSVMGYIQWKRTLSAPEPVPVPA